MMVMTVAVATHRPLRLILVTHADRCAARLAALLAGEPARPELIRFPRLDEALRHLAHADVDCVLPALELPAAPRTAGVERVLAAHPHMPIVALTGDREVEATRLLRAGAQDFVARTTADGTGLLRAAQNAVERRRTGERLEVERLVREVAADVRASRRPRRSLFGRRRRDARMLEAIIESSSDGVFVKDLEGRYLLVNEAAGRLLGLDPEVVVGRTDAELFGSPESTARRARDEAVLATGETRRYWRTIEVGAV